MGVCCIVFDIDGMLYELCMIFFGNKNYIFFFSFHVFFAFYAISNIFRRKQISNKLFFLRNTILSHYMFSSRFMLFATF